MHAVRNCVVCGASTDLTDFSRGGIQWSVCQPDINAIAVSSTLATPIADSRAERIVRAYRREKGRVSRQAVSGRSGHNRSSCH